MSRYQNKNIETKSKHKEIKNHEFHIIVKEKAFFTHKPLL